MVGRFIYGDYHFTNKKLKQLFILAQFIFRRYLHRSKEVNAIEIQFGSKIELEQFGP
jgi:hypothetical protein